MQYTIRAPLRYGIIPRVVSALRHPAFKLGLAFLLILLLQIQPNWLPLLDDVRKAGAGAELPPALTTEAYHAILDAYARQPWRVDWAAKAGQAALLAGQYETAKLALNTAARAGWTPELRITQGDVYSRTGEMDQAIQQWELARQEQPANASLLARLAFAYEAQGRYPEAAGAFRTLVALQPKDTGTQYQVWGQYQYRLGLILSAIDPESAPPHLARAAGLDETTQLRAESLMNVIEAGLQKNDEAYTFGSIGDTLISLGEYSLAKAALLQAIAKRPNFAEAYAFLGAAEDELGNDGVYAYQKALELNGQLPLAHHLLGLHYLRRGESEKAIPPLERAFELDPANADAAAYTGSAYALQGDLTTAEQWYRQAVQIDPGNSIFWRRLAEFYVEHDLRIETEGLLSAQKAVELAPASAEALDILGYAQHLNGDSAGGEANLKKAINLNTKLARAYFHLGVLYLDTNRPVEAKQALDTAASLDAGGPIAQQAWRAIARLGLPTAVPTSPGR